MPEQLIIDLDGQTDAIIQAMQDNQLEFIEWYEELRLNEITMYENVSYVNIFGLAIIAGVLIASLILQFFNR